MKSRRGLRDELIDHDLIVRFGREAGVDELDESEEEFGDRGDVGVAECEARLRLEGRGDPRGGGRDGMVDERAELAALHLGLMPGTDLSADDREIESGHHRHGSVVVRREELLGQDLAMDRQVEVRCELGEPAAFRDLHAEISRVLHFRKKVLGRDGLEDEREETFADVDLAPPDGEAHSRKALQVKVVSLEPCLGRSNVAAHRWPRRAEPLLEVGDVDRTRRRIEKRGEDLELAVIAVEDARPGHRAERGQNRLAPILVPRHPDADAAAPHHAEALGPKEGVDGREVVADDPTGQLELARDRLHGGRPRLGQEETRDGRLSAIERNDRHGGPNLNLRPSPPLPLTSCRGRGSNLKTASSGTSWTSTARTSWRTATGCWPHRSRPRTPSRRRSSARGAASTASRAGRPSRPGSIASPRTSVWTCCEVASIGCGRWTSARPGSRWSRI